MFTGNYFATTYFPDPYFFGAGVDSDDLYDKWIEEGQPAYFMSNGVVYMTAKLPDIRFIKLERGANPDPNDRTRRWDQYYGPNIIDRRRR